MRKKEVSSFRGRKSVKKPRLTRQEKKVIRWMLQVMVGGMSSRHV